ncbi:MAG: TonB-dependent receptor [Deltaproteobacteria bacterium]|nr:TonB-dependent receptor [Deltaproteobacteria bacterium]
MRLTLAAALAALASGYGAAATESLMLDEIVIRGQTESTREENLTIKEVRESPARDVGEALQQVEGVATVRKGAIANDVVVRGFQRDNINVLVDGARVHGACPNRMDSPAFHYDFAEVEQIQILKGPYDLENPGSLGALVDVKTKTPPPGVGAQLIGTYASYDSKNVSGVASYGAPRFDGLVGYAYKDSGVPKDGAGERITEIYPGSPADPNFKNAYQGDAADSLAYVINTAWTKWGLNVSPEARTEIGYSYQDAEHVLYPFLLMDARYDWTNRANWIYRATKVAPHLAELRLQAYWDDVNHVMDNSLRQAPVLPAVAAPGGYTMRSSAEATTWGAKVGATVPAGPGSLKLGADYYDRNWNVSTRLQSFAAGAWTSTEQPMIPDVTSTNVGAYTELGFPLGGRVDLKAGVRADLTAVDAGHLSAQRIATVYAPYYPVTDLDDSQRFREWGGNLQLTYRAGDGVELFGGLARGARPPDPQELYIGLRRMGTNWIGNPELGAPVNQEADVGAKFFGDRYYVNVSVFWSRVDDFINVVDLPDPDGAGSLLAARSYDNIDARLWGGEIGSQLSLPADVFLKGSVSLVRGRNLSDDTWLAEIPPLKGTVGLRYEGSRFFCEVAENFADGQKRVDEGLNEEETAGWATTDLKAGVRHRGLTVQGGVNNVLDRFYYTHLSYQRDPFASGFKVPENGRNYFLTATWEL